MMWFSVGLQFSKNIFVVDIVECFCWLNQFFFSFILSFVFSISFQMFCMSVCVYVCVCDIFFVSICCRFFFIQSYSLLVLFYSFFSSLLFFSSFFVWFALPIHLNSAAFPRHFHRILKLWLIHCVYANSSNAENIK